MNPRESSKLGSSMANISEMRENYAKALLNLESLDASPIKQFSAWFEEASAAQLTEPNAMTLATVNSQGQPSARIVLLKGVVEGGFTFYTNYESRKGQELAANPNAALLFLWKELERQVRIEGKVERLSSEESDRYFNSRPLGSRLGALASPQSSVIADRTILTEKLSQLEQLPVDEIKRPENWGGFRLKPSMLEFWQGRPNRLHDRFCYKLDLDASTADPSAAQQKWKIERLAP